MGLFSNEYVTTVGTQAMRIFDDKSYVPSVKVGMLKNAYSSDPQLVENVMEEMSHSIAHKAHRMYAYAKSNYTHGLPFSRITSGVTGLEQVKAAIASERGTAVNIDYMQLGPPNIQHRGWTLLVSTLGYNPVTNKLGTLTASKGSDVYLVDMIVVARGSNLANRLPFTIAQWGPGATAGYTPKRLAQVNGQMGDMRGHTKMQVNASATTDAVIVKYIYLKDKVLTEEQVIINIPDMVEGDYYQVRYDYGPNLSLTGYWTYKVGIGAYPAVDAIHTASFSAHGTFFPMAYVRFDKKNPTDTKDSAEYKTTEKMLKHINLVYKDLITQIHTNPSIGDVEQAIVAMMVPAITTNQSEQQYLFDFFKQLYYASDSINQLGAQTNSILKIIDKLYPNTQYGKAIIIEDKKFKTSLGFNNITQEIKVGDVCPVGKYISQHIAETTVSTPALTTGGTATVNKIEDRFIYRYQIAKGLYEEIIVYDLYVTYYIFGIYTASGSGKDATLLIPLDYSITKAYNTNMREELYSRSLHMIVNARVITTLKWYQREWFRGFMIVATFIITVASLGQTWKLLAAAIAAGATTYAIAYMIFIAVLKYMVVSFLTKTFVRIAGPKFAFIVAIIAVVVAISSGGMKGSSSTPWAADLLQTSTNLMKAIENDFTKSLSNLSKEIDRYKIYTETQTKLLEDANKLLESDNKMIPLIVWGERPDDFYNRTIHSGNIGIVGLDAIESYCDLMIKLPTMYDTIGAPDYDV